MSYWKQALSSSVWQYLESPVSLNLCILYLLFVNGWSAIYVSPGCPSFFSGINLSPANKTC